MRIFPSPGIFKQKRMLTIDDGKMDERVLVPKGKK